MKRMMDIRWATAAVVALTIAAPQASNDITPPPVPFNLVVPEGNTPYLLGQATGTQNYVCLQTATGFAWAFYGPQATLFNGDNDQITTHYLSPNPAEAGTLRATWQHSRDTSTVWAVTTPAQTSSDPAYVAPGAIPWLRLQTVGTQYGPDGGGKLVPTTFIHRVNTAGGIAPATGCAATADIGKKAMVPYTTDYIFYKAKQED